MSLDYENLMAPAIATQVWMVSRLKPRFPQPCVPMFVLKALSRSKNVCTGLALNNFDRFVDTPSGKDTLHDTIGIIFKKIGTSIEQCGESFRYKYSRPFRKQQEPNENF